MMSAQRFPSHLERVKSEHFSPPLPVELLSPHSVGILSPPAPYEGLLSPPPGGMLSYLDLGVIHDGIFPFLDVSSLRQVLLTCTILCDLVQSFLRVTHNLLLTDKTRRQIKEKQLLALALKTGNLQYLDLSECSDALTNTVLKCFINRNPDIRLLNISRCVRINAGAFQKIQGFHPDDKHDSIIMNDSDTILNKLEILIVNWCRNFTHECICALSHAPIRVLSMAGTWYTTDSCVTGSITCFQDHLECLNVNKCYKVSDESVTLLTGCPKLRILKISSCWRITDRAVSVVLDGCEGLEQFVMDDCRGISKGLLGCVSERGVLLLEGCMADVQKLWDTSQHYLKKGFRF